MAVFDLSDDAGAGVLRISGPLAHADCSAFEGALKEAYRNPQTMNLIVDLSGLDFICSTGMRLLVQYERALTKTGRRMVTAGMQGTVRETVEMCGVGQLLTTSPTVDAALADLRH